MTKYVKKSDFGPKADPKSLNKKLETEFKAIERALAALSTTTSVAGTGGSGSSTTTTTTVTADVTDLNRLFWMGW